MPVPSPPFRRRGPTVSWFLVLFSSAAVFLTTDDPLLTAILPVIMSSWPTLRTAFWLRASDPDAGRGRSCFWFYCAAAGWKAGFSALLTLLLIWGLEAYTGAPANMERAISNLLTVLGGFALATLLGLIAVASALLRETRVYVIPDLHRLCRGDISAIAQVAGARRRFNYAVVILALSLVAPVMSLGCGILIGVAIGAGGAVNPQAFSAGLGMTMLGPFALLPIYDSCCRRVIAPTPRECWTAEL